MLSAFITRWGFSMGLDDVDVSDTGRLDIKKLLEGKKDEVDSLIQQYHDGTMQRSPGQTLEETLEMHVQNVLSIARNDAANIAAEYIGLENEAVIMAKTGARGNMMNLGQMSANVGQQSVRGDRIKRGYQDRTFTSFQKR